MLNRLIITLVVIKVVGRAARILVVAAHNAAQLEAYSTAMAKFAAGQRDLYGADTCEPT